MEEEEIKKEEEIKEEPAPQETPPEPPQEDATPEDQNDEGAPALPEIVLRLREDYEKQINALKANYEKALSERDEIIRNLINGETEEDGTDEGSRVSQMISEARGSYKKW